MSIMISTPLVIGPASIGTSELVDGAVTAAKIDSGAAADGQVLTADGAGGAVWETPGGTTLPKATNLGDVGNGDDPVRGYILTSAYLAVTGQSPTLGAFVIYNDTTNSEWRMAIYRGDSYSTWMAFSVTNTI